MNYVPRIPESPPLAGAVEVLFLLEGYRPDHRRERLVPNGRMSLVIELDGRARHVYDNDSGEPLQTCRSAWLSGVHSRYITLGDVRPETRLVAVQFAPGSSVPFTHRAANTFCDAVVPAQSVFGESVLALRERLLTLASPEAVLDTVESWLAERHDPEQQAPTYLARALDRLLANPGHLRWTEFVQAEAAVSYRHFLTQFRRHVGPGPKLLQRILRFAQVFESLQGSEPVSWASLSQELGFADQAHLVREFGRFSGYRPAEFQHLEHDRVNFFPESDEPRD